MSTVAGQERLALDPRHGRAVPGPREVVVARIDQEALVVDHVQHVASHHDVLGEVVPVPQADLRSSGLGLGGERQDSLNPCLLESTSPDQLGEIALRAGSPSIEPLARLDTSSPGSAVRWSALSAPAWRRSAGLAPVRARSGPSIHSVRNCRPAPGQETREMTWIEVARQELAPGRLARGVEAATLEHTSVGEDQSEAAR